MEPAVGEGHLHGGGVVKHVEPEGAVIGGERRAHQHRFVALAPQKPRRLIPLVKPDLSFRARGAVVEKGVHCSYRAGAEKKNEQKAGQKPNGPALFHVFHSALLKNSHR
ncbi:hypothetical protein SDC9_184767 [bioreactor metagenome]|uniref:Uncharacterized protein n=1 Tax=bioreactor metagenome TaxID=1076179 RepID=A0A645HE16_9ZZZZ